MNCKVSAFMLACGLLSAMALHAAELFVSPLGLADNKGTMKSPLSFEAALAKSSEALKTSSVSEMDGLKITLMEGTYPFSRAYVLGPEFQGTKKHPIRIQAAPGAEVLFDGRVDIEDPLAFQQVSDEDERKRLAASAVEEIRVITIDRPELIGMLNSRLLLSLSMDDESYLPAVFPNEGYAMLNTTPDVEESNPPGIPKAKQKYGVRAGEGEFRDHDRPKNWRGSMDDPRGAQAGMVEREEEMAGTWEQWAAEIDANNRRNEFSGFYEAIWKLSRMPIYSVNAKKRTLRFHQVFSYGFGWLKTQSFRVFGLLCELDRPSEWYFDTRTNNLYIYPVDPIRSDTRIGLPVADGFMHLKDTAHVQLIGIHVRNVGSGEVFHIDGGTGNLIAGCSIKRCSATGASMTGTFNEIRSCDFVDLNAHVNVRGGTRSPTEITPGHNLVENCHFFNKDFTHRKINIYMGGVGNTFRNNLVHNSIGQAMVIHGNDQTIELNEFFNIGYEEGDGGAIYSGADIAGYGNLYCHNFFHHLMRTPNKKLGRAGIHLDDLQGGATCIGNVFFKSCSNGIYMNGGSGNTAINNLFLEGDDSLFNRGNWGEKAYNDFLAIEKEPSNYKAGLKEDYVGRALKFVGKNGWLKEPWGTRYPLMNKVMSDDGHFGRLWPVYCRFENNMYYGNRKNAVTLYRYNDELRAKTVVKNEVEVDKSWFKNYEDLDLRFVKKEDGVDPIPFEKIGLYLDQYRKTMPDKRYYRKKLAEYYRDMTSYEPCSKRIDTARLLEDGPWIEKK